MSEGGMSCYLVGGCVHEEGGGLLLVGGGDIRVVVSHIEFSSLSYKEEDMRSKLALGDDGGGVNDICVIFLYVLRNSFRTF